VGLRTPMIEFDNVTFQYNNDQKLLAGLSFAVPEGSKVAIVGPSGCGFVFCLFLTRDLNPVFLTGWLRYCSKSTVLRLCYRFYDPQQGVIRIAGQVVLFCVFLWVD
jgi:ABC transporter ATM